MIKLVIFDLDGTLLDSLKDLAASTNYALRRQGYPEHELRAYRHFVGNGINKLLERALPEADRTEQKVMRLREDFVEYYSEHKADYTAPYAGIVDLLEELKRRGLVLAVASNKYHAATVELIPAYFGDGIFDHVFGQREGIPIKPDPKVVFDIIEAAGMCREEVLYVGDSGVDMQTAVNSGVTSVGVTWGFRDQEELLRNGACHIADEPSEILEFVR